MKVKAICTHCGKKQTAEEHPVHLLNYVKCVRCNKEGELTELDKNGKMVFPKL